MKPHTNLNVILWHSSCISIMYVFETILTGAKMLTLVELDDLLRFNELMTIQELRKKDRIDAKRLIELQYHRSVIKDCIIERLSAIVEDDQIDTTKVA
jgi:hypothetical protein